MKTLKLKYCLTLFLLITAFTDSFGQKQRDEPISYEDDLSLGWKEQGDDTLTLMVKSKLLTPMQINFFSRKTDSLLRSFLLPPKDSVILSKYYRKNVEDSVLKARFSDSIRVGYFWGHESLVKPDLDYLYRLPFKEDKKYEVTQTFHGKVSHSSESSRYAVDFQLNVGEPVHAAREGIVVKVIDWFTKKGGKELTYAANKITIMHSDGTFASYAHLVYKGSFVKEGDRVEKGQKIGISGLTGHTTGAHLHFVVRKENSIAIPIYFEGYEGKVLKQGRKYKIKN